MATSKKINLEKSFEQLENIIQEMETKNLDLEKALSLFESGVHLIQSCQNALTQAEQKIQKLVNEKQLVSYEPEKDKP